MRDGIMRILLMLGFGRMEKIDDIYFIINKMYIK